jgi:hypothetical protein
MRGSYAIAIRAHAWQARNLSQVYKKAIMKGLRLWNEIVSINVLHIFCLCFILWQSAHELHVMCNIMLQVVFIETIIFV